MHWRGTGLPDSKHYKHQLESGQLMLRAVKVLSAVGGNSAIQYEAFYSRKKERRPLYVRLSFSP